MDTKHHAGLYPQLVNHPPHPPITPHISITPPHPAQHNLTSHLLNATHIYPQHPCKILPTNTPRDKVLATHPPQAHRCASWSSGDCGVFLSLDPALPTSSNIGSTLYGGRPVAHYILPPTIRQKVGGPAEAGLARPLQMARQAIGMVTSAVGRIGDGEDGRERAGEVGNVGVSNGE